MKRILLPLDGSIYSEHALDQAIHIAKDLGAHLTGMAVLDTPAIEHKAVGAALGASYYSTGLVEKLRTDALARTEKILEYFDERCKEAGIEARAARRESDPVQAIVREAMYHGCVILPQKTYFKFETQDEPENCVYQVAKHASRPVIAVPCCKFDRPIRRVLVAWDHSMQVARALQLVVMADFTLDEIILCTIQGGDVEKDRQVLDAHLARLTEYVSAHGIAVRSIVKKGEPRTELMNVAREEKADLIAMGAFSRSAWQEFFFGSVTKTMLSNDEIPIFVYH